MEVLDASGRVLIYKQDQHGNVVAVLNQFREVSEKYTYDAFGKPTILSANNTRLSTSAIGNRFMFQGREYFPELGIYDYRHRYYDPLLGHFLQTDPTGFDAGDMNLFRYCGDDPVDRSDPMGLEDIAISEEFDRLGIQASLNSRQSLITQPALGTGSRAQLIQENDKTHHLSLQPRIVQGYVESVYKYSTGSMIPREVGRKVIEKIQSSSGYTGRGIGHAHDDLRQAKPGWSAEDWATARGKPGMRGDPVWKALTSDGSKVLRLTPQTVPGQKPTEQSFSTKGIKPTEPLPPVTISPQINSSTPTASEVDAAHQSTGVPSLGAEAINFAPGRP